MTLTDNVTTEMLSLKQVSGTSGNVIGENGLVYQTTIGKTEYEYEPWSNYSVLGFFGESYVPLKPTDASKLAKLIIDSDDMHTLKEGEKLDLGSGYSLLAKQIDVDGNRVWLEFDKEGQLVGDEIVDLSIDGNWTLKLNNTLNEDNVPVLKLHVNSVFQGAVDSIVKIDGIWLIDYANAMNVTPDDEFGKLDDTWIIDGTIGISNSDTLTLTKGQNVEIGRGMFFKVADTPTSMLRFYAFKEIKDTGTHEIRGSVATGPATWTADNFAGFFYDLKKNASTEFLFVNGLSGRVIPQGALVYHTFIKSVDYKANDVFNGTYPMLGFFGESYVSLKPTDASKLAKLIIDSDDMHTLNEGEKFDLGSGYSLLAKQIDVEGDRVWLEFDKDGQYVGDEIVDILTGDSTWILELNDILDEDNIPVLRVNVNQVYQGAGGPVVMIDGLWLIDWANARKISPDDEFGKLNNVYISGGTITITNDAPFTLDKDSSQEIGEGMRFKVADSDQLRYYPYAFLSQKYQS